MKTKVIRMNPQQLDMEGIREAGEILAGTVDDDF